MTATLKTLVGFPAASGGSAGPNGTMPFGDLIADANGDLFGTTTGVGTGFFGTVFEIAKTATGYASTPTTLAKFDGTAGFDPTAGLLADAAGDLFGTASQGGANDKGTVFEIAKTATGYASAATLVATFTGATGRRCRSRG